MSKDEYLEFITHQPYDAMGDFSFLTVKQHPLGGKKAQTSPSKCLACFKLV